MIDWILKTGLAAWAAWNFWSLVLVFVFAAIGSFLWRWTITPKEQQDRVAWEQQRENTRERQTKARRLGITVIIWAFGFMGSSLFTLAFFKVLMG